MLGDSLLVAPIFNEEGIAEYYLPDGTWTSLISGEVKEGGRWYREKHDYLSIPLYVRAGSIVAVGARDDGPVYDYEDGVSLRVYALGDGEEAFTCVYNKDARKVLTASVRRTGNRYEIRTDGGKDVTVVLVHAGDVTDAGGADCRMDGADPVIRMPSSGKAAVEVAE